MGQKYYKNYQISDLNILLDSEIEIQCTEEFYEFENTQLSDYFICFRNVDILEEFEEEPIAEETGFRVFETEEGYKYQFFDAQNITYAVMQPEWNQKRVVVNYLDCGIKHISHTRGAFFHIRWEELLLRSNRLILHACCIDSNEGGILFSGISGVGKSTQGDLWCKYEQAKMINGDRPILYKDKNAWYAYGSPFAGSSKCHINEKTKVRAIVLLAQSKVCTIRRLKTAEAFRKIFAQLTVAAWNRSSIDCCCNLVEQLISVIPIYEMACTPDETAVSLLKNTLTEEVK